MRLLSLNIWGGKIYEPLIDFIKEFSKTTDIFCFQEVFQSNSQIKESSGYRTNIFQDICQALPDFHPYFAQTFEGYDLINLVDFNLVFGVAIFVKKSIDVTSYEEIYIHKVEGDVVKRVTHFETSRTLQSISFQLNNKTFNIYNLHGIWIPDSLGKNDTIARINQSKTIAKFIQKHNGEKIITGDFNLSPDTKSLNILEKNLKNLITDFKIPTTRSSFYTRGHKFADYTLVSAGVNINGFEVPDVTVSDHLPMILDFS